MLTPGTQWLGIATMILLGGYALSPWLRDYLLPAMPDSWMAPDVRRSWRWLLYKPMIVPTWDVEISDNKPRSLSCVLDLVSHNPNGKTICDFTDACVEMHSKGKIRYFYFCGEFPKVTLEKRQTEKNLLRTFQERASVSDIDQTEDFRIVLGNIRGQLIDEAEVSDGVLSKTKGRRRLLRYETR